VIMLPLDIYVANIQVQKNVNFWNGLYWFWYRWIRGATIWRFMLDGFSWVFFILFAEHTSSRQIKNHGHLMKVIDITRKFVNLRYQLLPYLYHVLAIYWRNSLLKPLVYYDQSDIKHIMKWWVCIWKSNLVCPILEPNA
jgi:hypothetical protein